MGSQTRFFTPKVLGSALAATALMACGHGGGQQAISGKASPLVAQCIQSADVPDGALTCSDRLVVACDQADPQTVYVVSSETTACEGKTLTVTESGPFAPGVHTIQVNADDEPLCTAELEVVDTAAPVLVSHVAKLWPPNHKFHSLAVSDCVSAVDACDGELQGEFIWASSDEPIDDIGDGHFGPDIGLGGDLQHVCVRSERQGPKDGRVYTLGVRVVDRAGNESEGTCQVIVDHDQRGVTGSDSGEAYRVTFDPALAGTNCDGTPGGDAGSGGNGGAGGNGGSGGIGDQAGSGGNGDEAGSGGTGDQAGSGGTGDEAGTGGSAGNDGTPVPEEVM